MAEFLMPKLGADMDTGRLLLWRKKAGERIERGEIIAEIHTDKADIEVESFVAGVIEKFLIEPGDEVPIGTPIAVIREEGEKTTERAKPAASVAPAPKKSKAAAPRAQPASGKQAASGRLKISPVAKKIAAELGIDPSSIAGSGPGGRITREDVEKAAAAKPATRETAADGMRQIIAAAMSRSKREIPHYYLSATIDMQPAMAWLAIENLERKVEDRLLPGVLLIKAVALALREAPELNASWIDGKLAINPSINTGVAISLRQGVQGGLIAPALLDADKQSLDDLMGNLRDLVMRARAGRLRSSEISGSTITITSLGEQGVESVFGIIYPPQVALVGFGKIVERPWVADGRVVAHPVMTATLSADHRASDGHRGGLFLSAIERLLREPEKLSSR
jgi:pyruvate dehydrogenase E2 component (dihydrolipoamide acetyltransferase)